MNIISDHDYETIVLRLEYLISKALMFGYPTEVIESRLANSEHLIKLESNDINMLLYEDSYKIFNRIFFESSDANEQNIELNWVNNWISQAYIYLIDKFQITFELLFGYLPIKKMFDMFKLYHEMDNSNLGNYLESMISKTNPLKLFLKLKSISVSELSNRTGINLNTLSSYTSGNREIKNMSFENAIKIANILKIRPQSLLLNCCNN